MSEKSLPELIGLLRRASWRGTVEYHVCVAMLDARIRRAEAAERAIDAFIAFRNLCDWDAWDDLSVKIKAYKDACEAVRKLEEGE